VLIVHRAQVSPIGADAREPSRHSDGESTQLAIAYQPVTATDPISTRPVPQWRVYRVGTVDVPTRRATLIRLVGLLGATALTIALAVAVVAGAALFAIMSYSG
jgi:hypothetical protein